MISILSWLWAQPEGPAYTPRHANIWAAMVRRNVTIPHEIALVTDMTEGLDPSIRVIPPPRDFEDVMLPTWGPEKPQCLRRISMFRPDAAEVFGTERFVNMDLDVIVTGNLDALLSRDEDVVFFRGSSRSRPYNGSLTLMTAGARPQVYTEFTAAGALQAGTRFVGSDQAWISHILGSGEAIWDVGGAIDYWQRIEKHVQSGPPDDLRLIFFPGHLKPWHVVEAGRFSWVGQAYRGEQAGRCLILGYAPTVWDEAAAAGTGFDMVIASPEAAEHREARGWVWGEIDAIGRTDEHALRLARMAGFAEDRIVFCGRQQERAAA